MQDTRCWYIILYLFLLSVKIRVLSINALNYLDVESINSKGKTADLDFLPYLMNKITYQESVRIVLIPEIAKKFKVSPAAMEIRLKKEKLLIETLPTRTE
jgi:hypothetical protein